MVGDVQTHDEAVDFERLVGYYGKLKLAAGVLFPGSAALARELLFVQMDKIKRNVNKEILNGA